MGSKLKYSKKQIAMCWINSKMTDEFINPDIEEMEGINGGHQLESAELESIRAEIRSILIKMKPRFQEFCDKQKLPIYDPVLKTYSPRAK